MVILISLGGVFEFYDLFFTGYVAPGMVKSGLFTPESLGFFAALDRIAVAGFGTFVFATFAGLWIGTWCSASCRTASAGAPSSPGRWSGTWSAPPSWRSRQLGLRARSSGASSPASGFGVELVTIDTYISELIPSARARPRVCRQPVHHLLRRCRSSRSSPGALKVPPAARPRRLALGGADRLGRRGGGLDPAPPDSGEPALARPARPHRGGRARSSRRSNAGVAAETGVAAARPSPVLARARPGAGSLHRNFRAALPHPHPHPVDLQHGPGDRLLWLRRVGADAPDRIAAST